MINFELESNLYNSIEFLEPVFYTLNINENSFKLSQELYILTKNNFHNAKSFLTKDNAEPLNLNLGYYSNMKIVKSDKNYDASFEYNPYKTEIKNYNFKLDDSFFKSYLEFIKQIDGYIKTNISSSYNSNYDEISDLLDKISK